MKTVYSTAHLEPQLANARDYWCGFARAGRTEGFMTLYRSDVPHRMYNGVLGVHSGHVEDLARRGQAAAAWGPVDMVGRVGQPGRPRE